MSVVRGVELTGDLIPYMRDQQVRVVIVALNEGPVCPGAAECVTFQGQHGGRSSNDQARLLWASLEGDIFAVSPGDGELHVRR